MAVQLYALSGVARCGATRSAYTSLRLFVSIGGVQFGTAPAVAANHVQGDGSLTINGVLNDKPNTAQFVVKGVVPSIGQEVIMTLGSINNTSRRFAGNIISSDVKYVGTPANFETDVRAIDYTWGLGRRLVNAQFTNATVATIAASLIASYAAGYTLSVASDVGAVVIDSISFPLGTSLPSALGQLMARAGGDWDCDYHKVVRLFFTNTVNTAPTSLTSAHPTLTDFLITYDASQMLTRVFVQGGGVNALCAVAVGETILPLEFGDWYQAGGGLVACGPQRISYTGRQLGGGGSLVGPGATPGTALTPTRMGGAGLTSGVYQYAYTDVTAAGESLPSPLATVTMGPTAAPSAAPSASAPTAGAGPDAGVHLYALTNVVGGGETTAGPTVSVTTAVVAPPTGALSLTQTGNAGGLSIGGGGYDYGVTFVTAAGVTTGGAFAGRIILTAGHPSVDVEGIPISPDPNVTGRTIYRTSNGGSDYKAVTHLTNNTVTGFLDTIADGSRDEAMPVTNTALNAVVHLAGLQLGGTEVTARNLYGTVAGGSQLKFIAALNTTDTTCTVTTTDAGLGANVPTVNTATANQVALSGIALGASGTTSRKVYRTAVGASQLKLQQTIANNTATVGVQDATADGSLGANAPTSDTSGLAQGTGQVNAGSTSLITASAAPFSATGGWALLGGGQVVRYTGLTGNTLTGIPATGPGSIMATIAYNSTITATAALTGVPASGTGAILYVIAQGDPVNLLAQVENLSGQAALAALVGGDGIQEGYLQDERIGYTEAVARGTALLDQRSTLEAAITYKVRDVNSRAGSTIAVSLVSPTSVAASFLIQQVTETYYGLLPSFTVQASSDRFTFEDLLRLRRASGGG